MLRFMRKHASRWVLGILLAIIIITFVFGFGFSRSGSDEKYAVVVGDYKISPAEYQDVYTRTESYYRMIYKDGFNDRIRKELKETVIKQLVDKYVLLTKAEEMGLIVTDREIQDNLDSVEYFKKNGKFDEKTYEEFLRRNNLNPQQFETEQRESMLLNKLISIIQDNGARIDDKAAYESYVKERGQVKLSLAVFDPQDYKAKVTIDDRDLEATYEREKATYRTENLWHLRYLAIDEKSGVRDDQAYMELLKSKDLAGFGRSKSLEVTDAGVMKESDLVKRFGKFNIRDVLKGMANGDISLPVRDGSVSYIFQLVNREEGKPFEKGQALSAIKERMIAEKARTMARAKAEDALKGKEVAFSGVTAFFPRKSAGIPGIGEIPGDNAELLALTKGQTYQKPVEINEKYYIFACSDEQEPDKAQWEKEKESYRQFFAATSRSVYLNTIKEDVKKTMKIKINRDIL